MRIAIVSGDDLVGDDVGQLSAALADHGNRVTAYVRQPDGPPTGTGESTDHGYQVVPICIGPDTPPSASHVLPFVGDWAAELGRLWSSDPPDVVHAHGWLGGLAAQLAARRQHLPTVQTFQGLAAMSRSRRADGAQQDAERERIEPLLARNATWATVESTADVATLARLRHGRARSSVLSGGVDVDRYAPFGPALARTDVYRVLCLAPSPLPSNGFDVVIRALPRIPGAELIVAETAVTDRSHDKARSALKHLAAELGVADRVRFLGTVAADELPMLMRSADVVACTPQEPPRATTVLQAMASGLAVVTLPIGVLIDAVVHDVTGLVLSSSRPVELATALRSLQVQHFTRESMGAAGRNRARSRFGWDRIALDSANIYRQLSAQDVPPAVPQRTGS